ncbi:glycosyltransferase family 2 protein [Sphingomonas daechungensis]|uniref:Glycosyltransferase family 2 protein n=1 Tax=Sphingomonas daechungensis TaxID=1176646 RepID=A0ABX6T135_9SPHN|nr:glycosyltransferase family 2 protein [Sphingomonas daechungensis]QNP43231.1 glycosyltransferase family 2 protein [Sphingomonas daechungensis]
MKKRISVISPVYNEGEGLRTYYDEMSKALRSAKFSKYDAEVLLVDNASTDDTQTYLEEIAAKDSRFKVIFNARNVGVFLSSFNALEYAEGDAVFLLVPSDLQDPLELMDQMIEKWEDGYVLVAGRRLQRDESGWLRSLRNAFYRMMERVADQRWEPGVGEYQLADRRVVDELLSIPDAAPYVRGMLAELGYKPFIIDYVWQRRTWGKSSFSLPKLFRTAYDMIFSFSRLPLKLIMIMGFIIASASFLFGLFQIVLMILAGSVAGRGIMTIIVSLFFFSGSMRCFWASSVSTSGASTTRRDTDVGWPFAAC